MTVSRASAVFIASVASAASVALMLTACSASPEEKPMPSTSSSSTAPPQDPNPSEPISQLVPAADLIAYGTVESVDVAIDDAEQETFPQQRATVRITEVLKGEAPAEITVVKPAGTWYRLVDAPQESRAAKHEGIFVLTSSGNDFELSGHVGLHDDSGAQRAFARVIAGQPEQAPAATRAQLTEWAEQADVIVFARARGTEDDVVLHTPRVEFSASGVLTPIEVLKGEMPEPLEVRQAPQPDVPGGTWAFPVSEKGQTGVYFIDMSGETPHVLNTTEPSQINRRNVPLGG